MIMKKNFKIGQSNEILQDSEVYDLHNLYDFAGVRVGPNCDVEISFDEIASLTNRESTLTLTFVGVDYLEMSPQFGTQPVRDLDEMGYKSPDDRDDQWLLTEQQAKDSDHLFFRFGGAAFIRVHSQQVRAYSE